MVANCVADVARRYGPRLHSDPHGCPCCFAADPEKECACTQQQIIRYQGKLSGALLDRIDIHVEVPIMETPGDADDGPAARETRREPESLAQVPEEAEDVNLGAPRGEIGSLGEGEALGEYVPYPEQAGVPEESSDSEGTTSDAEPGI